MKKKKAFITGIAGFAGVHLVNELLDNGYQISGSVYKDDPPEHINYLKDKVHLIKLDILKPERCDQIIKGENPEYIFHLAAFSSVGRSFLHEKLTYQVNFEGTLNVLQAALKLKKLKKLIYISSSENYGRFTPKNKTLTEDDPLNPVSPYAISKVAAEHLCRLYFDQHKFPVSIACSFNHTGPGQNEDCVVPSFCKKIAMIEKGKAKPVIKIGNPKIKRDISDVRDIVRGYRLLAEKGNSGRVYQLCSGQAVSIATLLNKLTGLSDKKIKIELDDKFNRTNDIPIVRGSNTRAKRELGYKNNFKLVKTLTDCLNYFRNKV